MTREEVIARACADASTVLYEDDPDAWDEWGRHIEAAIRKYEESSEVIEAAAKVAFNAQAPEREWRNLRDHQKELWRGLAKGALRAARGGEES